MDDYSGSLAALIDERVSTGATTYTKMGTVVSRETASALATVALDGSSGVPQPVKCFESVVIDVGDRVGLVKFERDWIVVGNYTPRTWGEQFYGAQFTSAANSTSTTLVTMPDVPKATINKMRDVTQLQIEIGVGAQSSVANDNIQVAALLQSTDGTISTDINLYAWRFSTAAAHSWSQGGITTALTLPGGGYTVTGRFARQSGTGTVQINGQDNVLIRVKEVLA